MATLAEYDLRPFDHPPNRSHPKAWRATTLTAEEWAHVCQDGVGHVEYHLEWSESEYAVGESPGEPFGVGQVPQNFRNGFPSELHGAIGHEDMDRRIGIPDIEVRIQRPKRLRIVTNRSFDDARLAQSALCRLLHPMRNAAANTTFVVE